MLKHSPQNNLSSALMNKILALKEVVSSFFSAPKTQNLPSLVQRHQDVILDAWINPYQKPNLQNPLIMDFPVPRAVRTTFLLFINYPVYGNLLFQHKDAYIQMVSHICLALCVFLLHKVVDVETTFLCLYSQHDCFITLNHAISYYYRIFFSLAHHSPGG